MALLISLACALGVLLSSLGCGDPLTDDKFRGAPIWTTRGELQQGHLQAAELTALRVGLFWRPGGAGDEDPGRWVEQVDASLATEAPSLFTMNLYEAPGPEHRVRNADGGDAGYAVGRLAAFQDKNGNGRRDADEPILGADLRGLVYAPAPLSSALSPTGRALPAGVTQLRLPQLCGRASPSHPDAGDCGVALGAGCSDDNSCGRNRASGRCLRDIGQEQWTFGYCVILDDAPCRPAAAAFSPDSTPPTSMGPFTGHGLFLLPCHDDAECARPGDRSQGIYHCDAGYGACVPTQLPLLVLGSDFVPAFCAP